MRDVNIGREDIDTRYVVISIFRRRETVLRFFIVALTHS